MKGCMGRGRWRWALMLPVLVFLLGESGGPRDQRRAPAAPAQARYEQALEGALRGERGAARQAEAPAAGVTEAGPPARLRNGLRSLARLAFWGTYGPPALFRP
ncbi:hypothetical protein ABZR71_03855 [Pseudomonas paraeruginosa]|nr:MULTISPECIES: hypothetical protein [Pseudomonas aeruginosa group]AVR67586.1 hypothetical protein B7D75_11700 [Pseudomonas paraeruginosa]AWE92510.1 hypothetical protein CSC28_2593 [Pseudomonas paraeruginosa]KSD62019.1 hypothetical protein AO903_29910 [Pseudomonas aeruginosa]KSF81932.1 hypothetical protein AO940_01150 [Pseudomonas aeruginosa]MBG7008635.1 hypothetical protein [Pseudomonas aeruginosa]